MADETCILDLPALTIGAGESAAILGANGSGKSTLVKLIARQFYPLYAADVRIFGQENWNVFELRRLLGIVSSTMQLDFAARSEERRVGNRCVSPGLSRWFPIP